MGRLKSLAALFGLLVACLIAVATKGQASASSITYKGITLTPAVINIDLQDGQPTTSFTINVTNNTATSQTLYASSLDFRSLNETGGVAFVGSSANQLTDKHGLASWLDIGKAPIDLMPHASKDVKVTIENRADLAPGGHYAAVLFNTNPNDPGLGTNQVALNQVVSTLVFASKPDGASYGIKLVSTSADRSWLRLPSAVNVVFQNTGDIQEIPRGLVTVTSSFAHEVSRGIINPDSNLVLPDSRRLYSVNLTGTRHTWWPGVYHVLVQYRYDGTAKLQSASATFFYISPIFTSVTVLIIIGLVYLIFKRRKIYRLIKRLH